MDFNGYVLRSGKPGSTQRKLLEKLQSTAIYSTRYIDEDCLYTLGIYHSVFHLLDKIGMHNIFSAKEPTYPRLTYEFLSSLIYNVTPNTASTVGGVQFRMFNREYSYSTDGLAELLGMPFGEGAICEAPLDTEWTTAGYAFWKKLTNQEANSSDTF